MLVPADRGIQRLIALRAVARIREDTEGSLSAATCPEDDGVGMGGLSAALVEPKVQAMFTTIARAAAATAVVLSVAAVTAPAANAEDRIIGGGSLHLCFVVPLPGSADISWCL